ncbi:MAG TPA: type II toxin-antitoxin system VapC family toxin [Candidatus Hydrogenedentes bacterium]|nr:type II toxin-antitoxin system VapC family toxin [Candidatus Hydrogenedentota bacterium]
MKYVLDTHVWIWWHAHPAQLSRKVAALLNESGKYEELLLSAISPWEFAKLVEKGRLGIACDLSTWIDRALAMPKLRIVPLSPAIACHSTLLPPPFHEDPADQIIVATAREEDAVILTKDKRIRSYKHVRSFW